MKRAFCLAVALIITVILADISLADDPIIYPAKGQAQDQMEKDKYECYSWAKKQTGFDPMEEPKATKQPPTQEAQQGGVGRGALRGGVVGLAAGAITGHAGRGAAIGAATGGLIGGMRHRD